MRVLFRSNMQTSFMHPPFGFALFYLRSVAPKEDYKDRVTGKTIAKVTTGQIYWGSVPFIVIQLLMVVLVLAFPGMVTHYRHEATGVNPESIVIDFDKAYGGETRYGDDAAPGGAQSAALPEESTSDEELNNLFKSGGDWSLWLNGRNLLFSEPG